jgi:hypothetical protein
MHIPLCVPFLYSHLKLIRIGISAGCERSAVLEIDGSLEALNVV